MNDLKTTVACPHANGNGCPSGGQSGSKSTSFETNAPILSRNRVTSTIPRSEFQPQHQSGSSSLWEYPSEDMYFRAMERKGWRPNPQEMRTIVAIHNAINEETWQQILCWEKFHPSRSSPKLKNFLGKPTEYSPKAKILNLVGWSKLPFDRHDWIVDRDGKQVRYVIDFYNGESSSSNGPLSVYLDVRPALDSFESVIDRVRWQFQEIILPFSPFRGAFFRDAKENPANPSDNPVLKPTTTQITPSDNSRT
uniref:Holocytochrome c-type synthase n=1 Tax=Albugo laibachii Nc14 TaxID=890382 RepID=F0X1I0_9STRA|nr:unnamed protein product [Albugo laibachii Nc14]CCA27821.1 cytochrome c1 heme lyase putative [Albugo laibachii Nc14]|eukprot:CCA27821.1 cytochrome c1 heme lyase putative [Albugo laibachii Nc14]